MIIDEAVELLENLTRELDIPQRASMRYAVKLGIEGLKAIGQLRRGTPNLNLSTLPGETKD